MKRHIVLVALGLVLLMSGCASLFEKEYYSVSDYVDESVTVASGDTAEVRNFTGLKNALSQMINLRVEHGVIKFNGYTGVIGEDLAEACWYVKSETAMGAYCVDYISYDLSQIVSYYEADVYITYSRTPEQVAQVEYLGNEANFRLCLAEAMQELDDYIAIKLSTTQLDAGAVQALAAEVYYADPSLAVMLPETQVRIFPDSGLQRIIEVEFDYGLEPDVLVQKKADLALAVKALAGTVKDEELGRRALRACRLLSSRCAYSEQAKDTLSGTAYGALLMGRADSEGFALAYAALCHELGVNCTVVAGRLERETHYWNIIELYDDFYHVDVSRCVSEGVSGVFMNSDAKLWGRYWWDTELYPACEGALTYYNIAASMPD